MVEIEYFIALCELPLASAQDFDHNDFKALRDIYKHFNEKDAQEIKEIEKTTNHDVKAVEYFLKNKFAKILNFSTLNSQLYPFRSYLSGHQQHRSSINLKACI